MMRLCFVFSIVALMLGPLSSPVQAPPSPVQTSAWPDYVFYYGVPLRGRGTGGRFEPSIWHGPLTRPSWTIRRVYSPGGRLIHVRIREPRR